jgi:hypothetical protein
VECGTHAVVDAGFWPYHTSERVGEFRLLRSVTPGMLAMWDRGFHDYEMFVQTRQRDAHILSRLPAHVKPDVVQRLADGSYLAYLRPSDYQRHRQGERLLVRVIEYTLTDPNLPGYGEVHRLLQFAMVAPWHYMVQSYRDYDSPQVAVTAPASVQAPTPAP